MTTDESHYYRLPVYSLCSLNAVYRDFSIRATPFHILYSWSDIGCYSRLPPVKYNMSKSPFSLNETK